jgi:sulfopyruvate decarboxylase TPP-binding subunit
LSIGGDEPVSIGRAPVRSGLDRQATLADALLARGITVAAYVPDSRLKGVLTRLSEMSLRLRSLTWEEECVA